MTIGPSLFVIGFVILIIGAILSLFSCEAMLGPCPDDLKTELPNDVRISIVILFVAGISLMITGYIINKFYSKKDKISNQE